MENEIKENTGKYMVDNLIVIEKDLDIYSRLTILAQGHRNFNLRGIYNGELIKISCSGYAEYNGFSNVLYLKGTSDFSKPEVAIRIPTNMADGFEEGLKQIGFIVVHSRDEANMYLSTPKTEEEVKLVEMSLDLTPTDKEIDKMISLVDLDVFTKIMQSRICQDAGSTSVLKDFNKTWAKEYLKKWAEAKYRFYKLFGDKLTLEKEVDYIKMENEAMENRNALAAEFPLYAPIIKSINERCYREDKIKRDWIADSLFESSNVKDNMTLTKFFALYGNKELDIAISKMYQSKGKSKIIVSIDPNDFLTVSLNKSGWESCHLFFEGCYQNAGLSYLFDETSLVSYSSKNDVTYSKYYRDFTWNNKRWREMVYVSKENSAMVFSRQYPYFEEAFSKEVRAMLEERFAEYFGVENKWISTDTSEKYAEVRHEYGLLYNDTTNGYDYKTVINKSDINKNQARIDIGVQLYKFSEIDEEVRDGDDSIW